MFSCLLNYDGSEYDLYSWSWSLSLSSPVGLGVSAISSNGINWTIFDSSNHIIDAGEIRELLIGVNVIEY